MVNLSEDFISIITRSDFDKFTVLEFRSAYIALSSNKSVDKNEAQRIVYRQILKLKNKGLLKRVDSKATKKTTYFKSDLFSNAIFNAEKKKSASLDNKASDNTNFEGNGVLKGLTKKIQKYKTELLLSMGESDEYKELYTDFPHLKGLLQERYNNARDKNSKILGRIKAIETLIELNKEASLPNETS